MNNNQDLWEPGDDPTRTDWTPEQVKSADEWKRNKDAEMRERNNVSNEKILYFVVVPWAIGVIQMVSWLVDVVRWMFSA